MLQNSDFSKISLFWNQAKNVVSRFKMNILIKIWTKNEVWKRKNQHGMFLGYF